jgi:hypothetical protein
VEPPVKLPIGIGSDRKDRPKLTRKRVEIQNMRNDLETPSKDLGTPFKEKILYETLRNRGVDIMKDPNLRPKDIKSLKKYLRKLMKHGVTIDTLGDYILSTEELTIRALITFISSKIDDINTEYHLENHGKAADTREFMVLASDCLSALTQAIQCFIASVGGTLNKDEFQRQFQSALRIVDKNLPLLDKYIRDFSGKQYGSSSKVLIDQKKQIQKIKSALRNLFVGFTGLPLKLDDASMEMFHKMYIALCTRGMGGDDILNLCDEVKGGGNLAPPAPEAKFSTYYRQWIAAHRNNIFPENGKEYQEHLHCKPPAP